MFFNESIKTKIHYHIDKQLLWTCQIIMNNDQSTKNMKCVKSNTAVINFVK